MGLSDQAHIFFLIAESIFKYSNYTSYLIPKKNELFSIYCIKLHAIRLINWHSIK